MSIRRFTKDPDAVLDYTVDWSDWLIPGDWIISVVASVSPAGLVVDYTSWTDDLAIVWLSGGSVGVRYSVTVSVVTAGGREDSRSIAVVVKGR